MCCCDSSRGILWSTWSTVNLLGIIYAALSFTTFSNMQKAYVKTHGGGSEVLTVLIANITTSLLVLAYAVLTFLLLLCKTAVRSSAGFSYGFLTSSGANLAVLLVLSSMLMVGFTDTVKNTFQNDVNSWEIEWSSFDTKAYELTFSMGFICAAGYVALFGLFLCMSSSMGKKEFSDSRKVEVE